MKKSVIIYAFLIGILFFLLITQMKSKPQMYQPTTYRYLQTLKSELETVKLENKQLEQSNREKEINIEKLKAYNKDELVEKYNREITNHKLEIGMVPVKGPGIEINMHDIRRIRPKGYDYNWDVIHDMDILILLNDLNYAGAEAISINEERIISTTGVMCGGPIMIVNGTRIGTPFTIKVIGDKDRLYAAITAPNTYGSILAEEGFGFEVEQKDDVLIPSFKGERTLQYAKPLEEAGNI